MNGNDLIVTLGGIAIAAAKSCSIDLSCDTIETSSTSSGVYKTFLPQRKTWKVSVSYLVSTIKVHLLRVGTNVTLSLNLRDGSESATGTAICTECKIDASRGSLSKGSFEFQGTGELTITENT